MTRPTAEQIMIDALRAAFETGVQQLTEEQVAVLKRIYKNGYVPDVALVQAYDLVRRTLESNDNPA